MRCLWTSGALGASSQRWQKGCVLDDLELIVVESDVWKRHELSVMHAAAPLPIRL
jgi:hypothetical protein